MKLPMLLNDPRTGQGGSSTPMTSKFQASVHQRGDINYVKLSGVVDEDNELAELVARVPAGTVVIDLGEVERINSCGVRDWVNWLGRLEAQGTQPVLVECSPAIVAQINLVNNFTGNGLVKSFYVPYFCPECDEEKVLLVEAGDMGPPPHEPPVCRCDECDLVMDFDDMPDSYFAFLGNSKKLATAERLPSMLAGSAVDTGKVKPRMSSTITALGSRPSVPSLPPLSRTSTPASGARAPQPPKVSSAQLDQYHANVRAAGKTPSNTGLETSTQSLPAVRASKWIIAGLLAALLVALAVLAKLLWFTA